MSGTECLNTQPSCMPVQIYTYTRIYIYIYKLHFLRSNLFFVVSSAAETYRVCVTWFSHTSWHVESACVGEYVFFSFSFFTTDRKRVLAHLSYRRCFNTLSVYVSLIYLLSLVLCLNALTPPPSLFFEYKKIGVSMCGFLLNYLTHHTSNPPCNGGRKKKKCISLLQRNPYVLTCLLFFFFYIKLPLSLCLLRTAL
uniref:Uncharacterized protein TCIL3000_7_1580 n=1 Tax=Trypanosoma congolense (strain IL3000) TaxID=1068625 RepID=G0UPP0_TRYCI|nr:unnamed protein product [Trypanosoma congolense IL3000]